MERKFVIEAKRLNAAKALAKKAYDAWRAITPKEKELLKANLTMEAKKNDFEPYFSSLVNFPVKFVEDNGNGEEFIGPMDLGDIMRSGLVKTKKGKKSVKTPKARILHNRKPNKKGLVAFAATDWDLPADYSEENYNLLMAGNIIKKGMDPSKVDEEEWVAYYTPINEVSKSINELRMELSPAAARFGICLTPAERAEKENELEELQEKRKGLNCLRPSTFLKWSEWTGNTPPYSYDGTEESLYSSCLKVRLDFFRSEEQAKFRKERMTEMAMVMLQENDENWRNRPDADNLRLSFDAQKRTKEAEDKAAIDEATSQREWLFNRFANRVSAWMSKQGVFAGETLDEYNAPSRLAHEDLSKRGTWEEGKVVGFRANDHRGWGELIRPRLVAGWDKKTVMASPSCWTKYALTKEGVPMTVNGFILMTLEYLTMGMAIEDYLECTGVSRNELMYVVNGRNRRNEKDKRTSETGNKFFRKFHSTPATEVAEYSTPF